MMLIALYVTVSLRTTAIYSLIYSSDASMVNPVFLEEGGGELFEGDRLTYEGGELVPVRPRINRDAPGQRARPTRDVNATKPEVAPSSDGETARQSALF